MKEFVFAVAVAALAVSPAFAASRHRNGVPERPSVEQLNRGTYQSNSQGYQSYPNPDREFYVQQSDR